MHSAWKYQRNGLFENLSKSASTKQKVSKHCDNAAERILDM